MNKNNQESFLSPSNPPMISARKGMGSSDDYVNRNLRAMNTVYSNISFFRLKEKMKENKFRETTPYDKIKFKTNFQPKYDVHLPKKYHSIHK